MNKRVRPLCSVTKVTECHLFSYSSGMHIFHSWGNYRRRLEEWQPWLKYCCVDILSAKGLVISTAALLRTISYDGIFNPFL